MAVVDDFVAHWPVYVSMPVIAAVIGYLTKRAAIEMMFRPLDFVGPREPCPCGSGKRFKQCHGKDRAQATDTFVMRPFEGLPSECDLIAFREIVPAGTAEVVLTGDNAATARAIARQVGI